MARKTFGQHVEDGLTFFGDGLYHFGEKVYKVHQDRHEYELETISLGLFSDREKLQLLKVDLYRAARAGKSEEVATLSQAIATIEELIERKQKRDTEPVATINSFICMLLALSFLVGCFSFPITALCRQSRSPFCNTNRTITDTITKQFMEPNND